MGHPYSAHAQNVNFRPLPLSTWELTHSLNIEAHALKDFYITTPPSNACALNG